MPEEYTREQLWKLYEKLPEELKDAIFSAETADHIYDICTRNGIEDDRISEIAKFTGRVLLGILPPEDFQRVLEKEVKLKKEVAKKVVHEINRFIFFPVKSSLEEIYKIEIAPSVRPSVGPLPEVPPREVVPPETAPAEEAKGADVYREPVE